MRPRPLQFSEKTGVEEDESAFGVGGTELSKEFVELPSGASCMREAARSSSAIMADSPPG